MSRGSLVTGGCGFIGSNFIRQLLTSDPRTKSLTSTASLMQAISPTWKISRQIPATSL